MMYKHIKDIINHFNNLNVDERFKILNSERVDNISIIKNIVNETDDIVLIFELYKIIYMSDLTTITNSIFDDKLTEIFSNPKSEFYDMFFDSKFINIVSNTLPDMFTKNKNIKSIILNVIGNEVKNGRKIDDIKYSLMILSKYNHVNIGELIKTIYRNSNKNSKKEYINHILYNMRKTHIIYLLPLLFDDIEKYGYDDNYIRSFIFELAIRIDFTNKIYEDHLQEMFKLYPQYIYKIVEMNFLYLYNSINYNQHKILSNFENIVDLYNYDLLLINIHEYDYNVNRIIDNMKNHNNPFEKIDCSDKLKFEILKYYKKSGKYNVRSYDDYIAFQHVKKQIIISKLLENHKELKKDLSIDPS